MIVLQSTHDRVIQQRDHAQKQHWRWYSSYQELQAKWNDVVEQINKKGGMDFLNNGTLVGAKTSKQFTDEELRSLLQLVHPDKHGGKQSAVTMTQKINALRG